MLAHPVVTVTDQTTVALSRQLAEQVVKYDSSDSPISPALKISPAKHSNILPIHDDNG